MISSETEQLLRLWLPTPTSALLWINKLASTNIILKYPLSGASGSLSAFTSLRLSPLIGARLKRYSKHLWIIARKSLHFNRGLFHQRKISPRMSRTSWPRNFWGSWTYCSHRSTTSHPTTLTSTSVLFSPCIQYTVSTRTW